MPILYRTWKSLVRGQSASSVPMAGNQASRGKDGPLAPRGPADRHHRPSPGLGSRPGAPRSREAQAKEVQGPGRAYPNEAELTQLGAAVRRLTRGFTGHRNKVGLRYLEDPELLGAYLLYYWPLSYLQTRHVATDLVRRGLPLPRTILDCGSGPGPLGLALADAAMAQDSHTAAHIHFLDHSTRALEIARVLATTAYPDASVTVGASSWNPLSAKDQRQLAASLRSHGKDAWDAVGFGHSLNELWADRPDGPRLRQSLLELAAGVLGPEGMVLAIEPALRESTDMLIRHRDSLVASGHPILGPCPWTGPCPALAAGQTCHGMVHSELPLTVRSIAARAGLDKERTAMAWLAFGIRGRPWPGDRSWIRVVSDPMVNKAGRTRFMVCSPQGRLSLSAKLEDGSPSGVLADFARLRRDHVLRVHEPEAREGGLGITTGTTLEIL